MWVTPSDVSDLYDQQYRIIDEDGEVLPDREIPNLTDDDLIYMFKTMKFTRHFDERAVSLQRQGRLGTYPPVSGHEASQIGSTFALRNRDWILPTYRESAVGFVRDVSPSQVLRYWRGNEAPNATLADNQIFPFNIGVGALIPHAAGMGISIDYQKNDNIILCHFGDGATSEGDFHEGVNFAGVFNTPTIFYCNNNQWAISTSRSEQTASRSIAQKAIGYGMRSIVVDGMDPLAVYEVTKQAAKMARDDQSAKRPTFIEAVLYRFGAHTTADDPSKYRSKEDVERWQERDPIKRFEKFLVNTGRIDEEEIQAIEDENRERMKEAIGKLESHPDANPSSMFENVFDEPTVQLKRQQEYLDGLRESHGDEAILNE